MSATQRGVSAVSGQARKSTETALDRVVSCRCGRREASAGENFISRAGKAPANFSDLGRAANVGGEFLFSITDGFGGSSSGVAGTSHQVFSRQAQVSSAPWVMNWHASAAWDEDDRVRSFWENSPSSSRRLAFGVRLVDALQNQASGGVIPDYMPLAAQSRGYSRMRSEDGKGGSGPRDQALKLEKRAWGGSCGKAGWTKVTTGKSSLDQGMGPRGPIGPFPE